MVTELPEHRRSSVDRVSDLVETVKSYAVQETVGPMKGAARWLAYGTTAALSLGLGIVLLAVGTLRLSQDLGGTALDGSWSFVHYIVAGSVLALTVIVSISRVSRDSLGRS